VPRRVSLPGAEELFRTTGGMALTATPRPAEAATRPGPVNGAANGSLGGPERPGEDLVAGERPSAEATVTGAAGAPEAAERALRVPSQEHGTAGLPDAVAEAGRRPLVPGQAGLPRTASVPAVNGVNGTLPAGAAPAAPEAAARRKPRGTGRRPSGRERHDEKITVYVSAEELMDLEHARLVLRGEHGLAVDRGRIVREAVAVVLADLEQRGEASILVRRLRGR